MSKLNPRIKPISKFINERLAGGEGTFGAKQSNIALLKRLTLANLLWEDVAYCDGQTVAEEIKRLVPLCNAEDVYTVALEARTLQKLRHTPLFLASEMCKYPEHRLFVADLLPKIITRADMLTDFLSIYWKEEKKPLANQAKKGLAAAFHNFNAYKLAKYDRDAAIKLRDIMFLVHPKPLNEKEVELFKMVASRTLPIPETWETMLSAGKDKKETWTKLINEKKIGGLAFLRNLKNMMNAEVDKKVIKYGFENLKTTMLLPINFLQAARMAPEFERDIEDAMIASWSNLPKIPGKTLFILDASGSMKYFTISKKSKLSRLDAAKAMVMLAANQCEDFELVVTAGDDYIGEHKSEIIKYPSKGFNLFKQIDEANNRVGGGGIFTRQCLEWSKEQFTEEFDRIIIFSDSQDCDEPNKRIPKPFGKHNYICDVSSELHGINYKGVWNAEVSGFSEHFLLFIAAYEGIENTFDEGDK